MDLSLVNRQVVEEDMPYGVYVWQTPDGEFLGDDDGNFMLIFSQKGDRAKITKLSEAAKHYGYPEGRAVFWAGRRPISDEEYEHQLARQRAGLTPDPLDIGALREERDSARHGY